VPSSTKIKNSVPSGGQVKKKLSRKRGFLDDEEARNARFPGSVLSLWLPDGSLNREYSILIPRIAVPPAIHNKNRMR
jgi:hypothetical protein